MIPTRLQRTALAGAEALINRALQYDPATRARLAELNGRAMRIEMTMPPLTINLICRGEQITLHTQLEREPDVSLKGSAIALAGVALNGEDQASVAGSGVDVRGSLDVLQKLKNILSDLDVDWEAALAQLVGDIPAHMAAQAIRSAYRWQQDTRGRVTDVAANFIRNEARVTPSKPEMEQFTGQVRHLATDVDRLAARVNRLRLMLERKQQENRT